MKLYFSEYRSLKKLFKAIYYRNLSIEEAERIQNEYEAILYQWEKYNSRNPDYIKKKKDLLINAQNFYDRIEMILLMHLKTIYFQ